MKGRDDITVESFTANVVHYIGKYSRQIKILEKANKMGILITQFERYASYLLNHVKGMSAFRYKENPLAVPYFAGGLFNVLVYWSKHNFKESEQEMTALLHQLISSKIPELPNEK